jgi:hypothetical protein
MSIVCSSDKEKSRQTENISANAANSSFIFAK